MTRAAAVVVATLVLAGCGSSGHRAASPPPKLPIKPAADLAQRSDRVATALDAGDPCRALGEAQQLQQDTIQLINEGRIPAPFQEYVSSAVADLLARINCVPPDHQGHGKGKGHGKHKHGEGD